MRKGSTLVFASSKESYQPGHLCSLVMSSASGIYFLSDISQRGSGHSCSKLMMSLVNDLLKFTSSDTQIC